MWALKEQCPVCGSSDVPVQNVIERGRKFYWCRICGRYDTTLAPERIINDPRLAHYLYYDCFQDRRYHTTLSKEECDAYNKINDEAGYQGGRPVHMDEDIIANWYPKTFAERVDQILIKINELSAHIGQQIEVEYEELLSLLFIDRKEWLPNKESVDWRMEAACSSEAEYMINVLQRMDLVTVVKSIDLKAGAKFVLTPAGYARVDELQKNNSYGRQALVAMEFGEDTKALREAIREGITSAKYNAIFIDEVEHNEFITPELLKHIRDSKFVVAELTHRNRGAYFEEGYAMGLGKPVIQLCRAGATLHFDIAQKNTILWQTEKDIPERLENRIRATID